MEICSTIFFSYTPCGSCFCSFCTAPYSSDRKKNKNVHCQEFCFGGEIFPLLTFDSHETRIPSGTNLSWDVTNLSWDVTNLAGDVTNLSWDVTNLAGDVTNLSGDVTNLSGDVVGIGVLFS